MVPEKACRPSEVMVSDVSFAASILSCNSAAGPAQGRMFAAVPAAGSTGPPEMPAGAAGGDGSGGSALAAAVIAALRAEIHRQPNQPPARTASITAAASAIQRLCFAEIRVTGSEGGAGAAEPGRPAASEYSARRVSSSNPRKRATARTKPRLKMPPGRTSQVSFSNAWRKRVLIRVAAAISSSDTPRISRSRLRCSPNPALVIVGMAGLPCHTRRGSEGVSIRRNKRAVDGRRGAD
jgi:hypothetical protein